MKECMPITRLPPPPAFKTYISIANYSKRHHSKAYHSTVQHSTARHPYMIAVPSVELFVSLADDELFKVLFVLVTHTTCRQRRKGGVGDGEGFMSVG